MRSDEMVALVERYFAAVDGEDLTRVLDTLDPDCAFTVETHGIHLLGHRQIKGMFRRLWGDHKSVRHFDFVHVPDAENGRIAVRFKVENTEKDGSVTEKSNCNFFELRGEKFSAVAVYMAGPNTLT